MLNTAIASVVNQQPSVAPQVASAGAINGASVDTQGIIGGPPLSAAVDVTTGALTGGPTTETATIKVQDSADNATFADYIPPGLAATPTAVVAAANARGTLAVDLSGARRYLRVVCTVAFTGGASPTMGVSAGFTFGGLKELPAAAPVQD